MARLAKKCILLVLILCMVIPAAALAASPVTKTVNVTTAAEMKTAFYDEFVAINSGSQGTHLVINIMNDIDMGDVTWEAQKVNNDGRYFFLTVNGNNHTITGLKNMLVAGTWAGEGGVKMSNLTLSKVNIVFNAADNPETDGVGAFIGMPSSNGGHIKLENCHLIDSHVEGGHWTGGMIGYASGYSGNDGPVFMNVDIIGCSVLNSTITGKGSVGGVMGHALGDPWTGVSIETAVVGNTITSTGSSKEKAGALVDTLGTAGNSMQPAGEEEKTGFLNFENCAAVENDVTSGGEEIKRIFGRRGSATEIAVEGGIFDQHEDDQNASELKINKTGNPVFRDELGIIIFKDGENGNVFDDAKYYMRKGDKTEVFAVPEREDFVFVGWSPAVAETVTGDATYTAMWMEAPAGGTAVPGSKVPTTGDNTPIAMLAILLALSAGAMVWTNTKRKANQH